MSHTQIDQYRHLARQLFDCAVEAADPARALEQSLIAHPFPATGKGGRTLLIAIGKAAPAMLKAALAHVQGAYEALAVTHYENTMDVPGATVMRAAHPVPDEKGRQAADAIIRLLASATEQDRVIALMSGGGSALAPAPIPGICLQDKADVNRVLLSSGLDIIHMNLIRQQLSQLKGGGLLRHAAPAPVTAYILSDVIGDDLRVVASGPTVAPIGTRADARRVCIEAGILHRLPKAVQHHFDQDVVQDNRTLQANNILIGSNRHSLQAALSAMGERLDARIVSDHLVGDVEAAASEIVQACRNRLANANTPQALLFGGETTVQIKGDGLGGRNQELALRVAKQLSQHVPECEWVFLSGGTDGRDGPTDAAGAIVCSQTLARIRQAGLNLDDLLDNNDSYRALEASGDLLMTQATGTNVADIQCLILLGADA